MLPIHRIIHRLHLLRAHLARQPLHRHLDLRHAAAAHPPAPAAPPHTAESSACHPPAPQTPAPVSAHPSSSPPPYPPARRQRPIQQPQIHRPRRPANFNPYAASNPAQPIRPRLKLIPHPQPATSPCCSRRLRPTSEIVLNPKPSRIVPPHHHRKRILKPQPGPTLTPYRCAYKRCTVTEHPRRIPLPHRRQRLLQNRRQRRPRVLHIRIDPPAHQRLLAQITPRQIEPPLHPLRLPCRKTASISCATNSPSTTCSVKFFAPTTIREDRGGAHAPSHKHDQLSESSKRASVQPARVPLDRT